MFNIMTAVQYGVGDGSRTHDTAIPKSK